MPGIDESNIVCYPDSDHEEACPITSIKFVKNSEVDSYMSNNYTARQFDESQWLVFAKHTNNLPITTTKVEYKPCMDSFVQSSVTGTMFY